FYDIETESWINVWGTSGDTLQPFQHAMVPITEARFLKNGFQFSFRNKASLPKNFDYRDKRGNVDHWNIDYVILDKNRSINDTIIRDVAFSEPLTSMVKNYQSIPWDHLEAAYNSAYLPYFDLHYFNNDTAVRNVTRFLQVYDQVWDELYKPNNASTQDIFPSTETEFQYTSIYPFQFNRGDTASLLVKSWLRTDDFDNKTNDTITRRQVFKDYFAYDDGSAERAYGLRGQGTSNALIAVRYNSFIADELGGVDIYFTQLLDSLNEEYYYKFMVWDDADGQPGNVIYDGSTDYQVKYSDRINEFIRFEFDRTVPVNGVFYVGVLQYNQYMLNIGMDVNTNKNNNLLFNLGGEWQNSDAPGNIMLRPYVMRSYSVNSKQLEKSINIKVWPNPTKDILNIESYNWTANSPMSLAIYDISGKKVRSFENINKQINVGDMQAGIYFLVLSMENQPDETVKFVIH
ncbi:MAG TPA: T9SS type A sorting domain-containing protein, partial [Bacteroidales bacterium]|nr:T9SS type A sorting domain-containing protein [Bacteroidales bacterium]